MGITKLAIKFAAPFPKVQSFNRYLFVGPHPDDIEIGAGATVAALAAQGKSICFLICTDGRYGTVNLKEEVSEEKLISTRKEEAVRSAAALGVSDVRFLELSDGGFYKDDELLKGIAGVISDFQPDVIFAPDPSPTSECHIDHLNVGKAVRTLAISSLIPGIMKKLGAQVCPLKAVAFYMTAKPNVYMKTTGFLKKQLAALFENHLSQYPKDCPDKKSIELYLKLRARDFGFRSFHITAEGFRILGTTHMHCLPEAGL
ncbi:MAG: PIG-L family deacetylase [Treponema sp.]|nr:PIG-L family deacetylase [Treponema sp.]